MRSLRDIDLQRSYRTGRNDIVNDFYIPCLNVAILYRRAAGYFTSAGLAVAARGVARLIDAGGKMCLVASPHLEEDDIAALRAANRDRSQILEKIAAKGLKELEDALVYDRLHALSWLAASGQLEVKLALRRNNDGDYADGIYHEKMGILTDSEGNHVAFSGSSNETAGGLINNFESIKVFRSWNDPEERVQEETDNFQGLWTNKTTELEIIDFTDASEELLKKYKKSRHHSSTSAPTTSKKSDANDLWQHQKRALKQFMEHKVGIIEMATGTGKTRLATAICDQLQAENNIVTIIICTDGTDLLNQWYISLLTMTAGFNTPWALYRQYGPHKERQDFALSPEKSVLLTSRQFLPATLKSLSIKHRTKAILIHDEVHGLGSPANRKALAGLASGIPYRLGLSATPDREYDEEGNVFIAEELGQVIFKFGLEDAIREGVLAPFEYHPIKYFPSDDDRARTHAVYAKKAARAREGNPMSNEEFWTELAKVHKTSKAKLPPFREFLAEHKDLLDRCIIFVETMEYGSEVLEIVHTYSYDFHTYFSDEDANTLVMFARGDIQCLLTCHRLSQGIDIQSLTSVILFSSARARLETIQRIGRCLRKDPRNPNKIAHIIDFVRADSDETVDCERAEWLTHLSTIRPGQESSDATTH